MTRLTEQMENLLDTLLHYSRLGRIDLNLVEVDLQSVLNDSLLIVLSTSKNPRDIAECYRSGVNSYQIKQVSYENFFQSMQSLFAYWL